MRPSLRTLAIYICVLCLAPTAFGANVLERTITKSDWPEFANGANVARLTALQDVLGAFDEAPGTHIEIRYPGGATGEAWGQELLRWFVAYGVPGKYLRLAAGSGGADQLLVLLVQR